MPVYAVSLNVPHFAATVSGVFEITHSSKDVRRGSMMAITRFVIGFWALFSVLCAPMHLAVAQSDSYIEKVGNKRISGRPYVRMSGLSYAQCEQRCLQDPQCKSLEHYRGGGVVIGRNASCRLFSDVGDTRDSRYADVGFKRTRAAARPTEPSKKKAKRSSGTEEQSREPERRRTTARKAEPEGSGAPRAPAPGAPAPTPRDAAPETTTQPGEPSRPSPRYYRRSRPPEATAPPEAARAPEAAPAPAAPPRPPVARSVAPPPVGRAAQPQPTEWDIVPVYFGTDRKRATNPKRLAYGSDRARKLELGRVLVTVPKAHQVPNIERPWSITVPYFNWTLYQETEDPRLHFTINEIKALSKEEALFLIRERLAASKEFKNQALIFVHGYNNGFDDAVYRTAQIAYDLKFDGASFLYSWPSGSGLFGYTYDRESSQQAEQYLTEFLTMVLSETGAESVNIIAHSMGNQPLLQVLRDIKRTNPGIARFNQIILAAPDVDRDAFTFLASQIKDVGRGITMYASSNDVALNASRRFAGGVPRAGDISADGPVVVPGIDTIDISALSTDYLALNHSTYAERTVLLQDIEMLIRSGLRPPQLRLPNLERVEVGTGAYWRYPR